MKIAHGLVMITIALMGCGAAEPPSSPLPIETVTLRGAGGEVALDVEVAADRGSREYGLMKREALCERCGMMFVWEAPVPVVMWMKDTPLPLDMAFVRQGRIVGVVTGKPYSLKPLPAPMPVEMVLEVEAGRLAEWGIGIGSQLIRP